MAVPATVPYGSAKAALNAMSVSLAKEYAPKVRVNALMPGPFLTEIAEAWSPEYREKQGNMVGRPGPPEEILTAALALALASPPRPMPPVRCSRWTAAFAADQRQQPAVRSPQFQGETRPARRSRPWARSRLR